VRCILLALLLVAACDRSPGLDEALAAKTFTQVSLDTEAGLSGLALDDQGRLWTVAERTHSAYRITLDGTAVKSVERFVVEGVPTETDLEAVAWLGPGRFALGTEAHVEGRATVLLARERGDRIVVDGTLELPSAMVGVEVGNNAGAEGVCGRGDLVFAAIETCGDAEGRRFAPIARVDLATGKRSVSRVWLTSPTGKIAGLDCTVAADGSARMVAIERHFTVSHVIEFDLPPTGGDIVPERTMDLSPILRGSLNLEGIVRRPDGRWIVVNDNQSGSDKVAASKLLLFK
jgi:hypothetical protein